MKFQISSESALFLDRDGVLNERIVGDYVRNADQLIVFKECGPLLTDLRFFFKRIFVVTNQQGIGKGLMKESDLTSIHHKLLKELNPEKELFDAIFYCSNLKSENHPDRKPGIGMALKAKSQFPDIDLNQSLMIGDSVSDLEFGKNAGMVTWYITKEKLIHPLADAVFSNLYEALQTLLNTIVLEKGDKQYE